MKLYGTSFAVYTGKIEAYLRAKGFSYHLEEVDIKAMKHVEKTTGLHKVPAIELGNNHWLSDSSLIIEYLEAQHPEPKIYLSDPVAHFISLLLEEYFDEWVWLQCIYLRFCDADGGQYMINAMARRIMHDLALPQTVKRWLWARNRKKYLKDIGAGGANASLIEDRFLVLLEQLETVFSEQPYLMGQRPSVADFGLFGPMFRHFVSDPYSGAIVRDKAPNCLEWSARLWNIKPNKFADIPEPTGCNPLLRPLLKDFNNSFVPYLYANYEAFSKGKKVTHYSDQGSEWDRSTVPHRVWSVVKLQASYRELPDSAKNKLREIDYIGAIIELMESSWESGDYSMPTLPIRADFRKKSREL